MTKQQPSFTQNINYLARNIHLLERGRELLTPSAVQALETAIKLPLEDIVLDVKKGVTEYGRRKIDVQPNLNSRRDSSWVTYSGITIFGTSRDEGYRINFAPIFRPQDIAHQINLAVENFNTQVTDPERVIINLESQLMFLDKPDDGHQWLLRYTDTTTTDTSTGYTSLSRIILHVTPETAQYAYEPNVEYSWYKTTSSILLLGQSIHLILTAVGDAEASAIVSYEHSVDAATSAAEAKQTKVEVEVAAAEFMGSIQFDIIGNYAAGIEVTSYRQVIKEGPEFWRAAAGTALPYTTTGFGMPEGDAFVPAGDAVLRQDLANPDKGAAMVATDTGTVQGDLDRLKAQAGNTVSAKEFGAMGDGVTDDHDALQAAWDHCIVNAVDLYLPSGTYLVSGGRNFPFRQQVVKELLDCKNITIFGDGPTTILKTDTVEGADVLQLNGLKNLNIRNLKVTSVISGSVYGSNGVSVTGGYDNLTMMDVWAENLPSIDKGNYIDGGKALTLQSDAAELEVGKIKARIFAKGCAQGFGMDADLVNFLGKKCAVDVDITAEDCFTAFTFAAPQAGGALPAGSAIAVRVRGQSINCQKDVVLNRAHGVDVEMQVVTTKTEDERRRDSSGIFWFVDNLEVEALICNYAKNSRIVVTGNKGPCAYKAQIGAWSGGTTQHCDIYLDIAGTPSLASINDLTSAGVPMAESYLYVSFTTAASLPASFYEITTANVLSIGPSQRLASPSIAGRLGFYHGATGVVETAAIDLFGSVVGFQGKVTGTPSAVVAGLYDSAGTFRLGIMNGNGIVVDGLGSSSAIGAYVGKQPVYNSTGTLIGWFPIYA